MAALTMAAGSFANACDDDSQVSTTALGTDGARPGAAGSNGAGSSPAGSQGGSEGVYEATGTGPRAGQCVAEECPEANLLGSPARGCCQQDGTCGASVDLVGASLCVPANLPAPAAGNPSELLPTETIVPDPSCQGRSFFGTELPGCCDPTGVCGVSTEPFASGGAPLPGLAIPITCIAPGEISVPGLPAPAQTVAPIACGVSAGDEDAGAAPNEPNPSNQDESTLEDAGSDAGVAEDAGDPEQALDAGSLDAGRGN